MTPVSPVGGEVDVAQELRRHMVYAFNGTEVLCDCHEVGWLTRAEYAAHAQAALLARLEAAESARDEALAVAWDEGFVEARGHLSDYRPNPYRAALTPSEVTP